MKFVEAPSSGPSSSGGSSKEPAQEAHPCGGWNLKDLVLCVGVREAGDVRGQKASRSKSGNHFRRDHADLFLSL